MRALCLMFILCAAVPVVCGAAAFPVPDAPAVYSGGVEEGGTLYSIALRLKAGHRFILRERIVPSGERPSVRTLTGSWFQIQEGALLQLTNRNGLERLINVGGEGTLYYGVQAPFSHYMNVSLRKGLDEAFPYAVMGTLTFEGPKAVLRDAATGEAHALLPSPPLASIRHEEPQFVDVDVEEEGERLRISRVRGASPRFPDLPRSTPALFRQTIPGLWRVMGTKLQASFQQSEEKRGTLEVRGEGIFFSIPYMLKEDEIDFRPEKKIALLWRSLSRKKAVLPFNGLQSWEIHGVVLAFAGPGGRLCLLEKIR